MWEEPYGRPMPAAGMGRISCSEAVMVEGGAAAVEEWVLVGIGPMDWPLDKDECGRK